eukprot:g54161.t1
MADQWVEATDPKTKRKYYYNKKTKKTQWTKPAEMDQDKGDDSDEPEQEDYENNPAYWSTSQDPKSRRTYYYNKKTKATSWSRPACLGAEEAPEPKKEKVVEEQQAPKEEEPKKEEPKKAPADVWKKAIDPRSGKPYWYNKATKETTWKNPEEADEPEKNGAKEEEEDSDDDGGKGGAAQPESEKQKAEDHGISDEDQSDDGGADSDEDEENAAGGARAMAQKKSHHDADAEDVEHSDEEVDDDGHEQFTFSKHRKGWVNRTFRFGAVHDDATMLTFKKSLIKKALLKRNRHLDAEAIQSFKNVMSYMGDRKSSKGPIDHAKKMLRNLMVAPVGLRDEVYMQLCKQTTGNPKPSSTVKGWELMTFCLATFPPSKQLKGFLMDYVNKTVKSSPIEEVRKLAKVCSERVATIVLMGQRKQVPSKLELECLKATKPVPIRVNLADDTFKTFTVDPYTLNKDVEEMLVQKYGLVVTSPFALYEGAEEKNLERILDPKDRVLDVMASWENAPLVEEVKLEQRMKKSKNYQHKDMNKTVVQAKVNYCKFIYKAKLVLKTSNKEIMSDPEAINLIYIQATQDVVSERYPAKVDDITVLAALQLQATFGDYKKDIHFPGWLKPKLEQFMPSSLFSKNKKPNEKMLKEWEQMILNKYQKVSGFTSLEAKLNYLDYVQEWTFYGSTFFLVEQWQFKDYPNPLVLGINCEGVLLMHPEKKSVLENYGFTDIVTWGHSDEKFIIVVGNIVQQRKLIFKTINGQEMNHLIHDYVKFKVKNKAQA